MKVSQVNEAQNQVVLNIEVDPPELEEHMDRVYKRAVQRVNIRGFRKGKAPRSILELQVGRDNMLEEAYETLLPQMTAKAIEEKNLDVVATPRVQITQNDPLTIEATVAVRPSVVLGDYASFRLETEQVEVTSEAVEDVVNSLLQEAGTWEPVERSVELGDMITMEVHGLVEEASIIDDKGVDYIISAESANPIPGFADQLLGINRGDVREFTLPFPDDYPQPEFAGKDCNFTVTLEEVKERKLPELDDEFVQTLKIEEVESVPQLMDKLRSDILKHNQQISDQNYQEKVVQALIDGAQLEIPPLMVDEEVNNYLADQAQAMERQQIKMEDYLNTVGKSVEQLQEEVRPSAVERITRTLTLMALREQEAIDVSPEEIEEELDSILGQTSAEAESLRQMLSSDNGKSSIANALLNRKTLERLTSIAKGDSTVITPPTDDSQTHQDQTESERGAQDA